MAEEGVEEWGCTSCSSGSVLRGVGWEWECAGTAVEERVEVDVNEGGDGYGEEDREEEAPKEGSEGHLEGRLRKRGKKRKC